jgi:hypothetical protein
MFADLLLEAATMVRDAAPRFASTEHGRPLAKVLASAGRRTGEIAERIRQEEPIPQDLCFELRQICADLTDTVRPVLSGAETGKLDDLLRTATNTRGELRELWEEGSPYSNLVHDRDRVVTLLDEVTRQFLTTSRLMRGR